MRGLWVLVLGAVSLYAQLPGNSSLQGTYYLRYLGVIGNPCDCPLSFQGTVVFDGKGTFQMSGQGTYNNGSDHSIGGSTSGHYQVLSSGALKMDNVLANSSTSLSGGIGAGVVIASSTDSGYLDLLVAIPAGTKLSNSTLSGPYQLADIEFAGGSLSATRNTFFSANADGNGGLGTVTVNGTSQVLKNAPAQQTISGATYSVGATGSGTLNLPAPAGIAAANQLLAGNKTLYAAADGSFFIAGTSSGYDLVVGVKLSSAGGALQGNYFSASLQNLEDGSPGIGVYGSQGALTEIGNAAADELIHQRINADNYGTYEQTASDTFLPGAGGIASYSATQSAVGAGGNIIIGSGNGANFQLSVSVKAATLTGPGVFLNPQGVVNAASSAPFTGQISPGEVISLYGSGLSSQTLTASAPFPNTLGGVGVTINGTAAPVYFVRPDLVSVVVPYSTPTGSMVTIQLTNNGAPSNQVQVSSGLTSAGVFTVPAGGLGNGAILHADYSLVTPAHPARAGETIQIFLTGLGAVQPAVVAGAAAPVSPLSVTVNHVAVYIDSQPAAVAYQGLAPTLAGLYQLNVVIPPGVRPGNVSLEIATVDADNIQATIPITN